MHVVVGLGNPGYEYEKTKHNIGFAVADAVAQKLSVRFQAGPGEYWIAAGRWKEKDILLIKPVTYMNNSGIAVKEIIDRYGLRLSQLLAVVDDFHVPLGVLRIRPAGSDGGHNGLASIIYHLQSDEFPRLRCGIKSDAMPQRKSKLTNFVLTPFERTEGDLVRTMVDHAGLAALAVVADGLESAMNQFN